MTSPRMFPAPMEARPETPVSASLGNRELQRALAEKTTLLHEVDHRVKNNLQLISSLLLLQTRRTDDAAVKCALRSAQARVNAVAIVHRRLFQGDDPHLFDLSAFLRDMVGDVVGGSGRADIRATLALEPIRLPASHAAALALLVGEVLENIVRHAFPDGRPGRLNVSVTHNAGEVWIEITDDGVGMAIAGNPSGFGGTIVKLLSQQLHARIETADASPGLRTLIRLPLSETTE
ncbi:MAG: sensor histidine kinase [Caulobacter sp.]|nr:sensor histidine kinase [Caulobacter sp.]